MTFKLIPLLTQAAVSVFPLLRSPQLSNSSRILILAITAKVCIQLFEWILLSFSGALHSSNMDKASLAWQKEES